MQYSWRDEALCARIMFLTEDELASCKDDEEIYVRNVAAAHNIFFPARGDNQAGNEAKTICQGCPVAQDCLAYALKTKMREGVWGGTSGRLRRRIQEMRVAAQVSLSAMPQDNDLEEFTADEQEFILNSSWDEVWGDNSYMPGMGLDEW